MKACVVLAFITLLTAIATLSFRSDEPADKAALGSLLFFDPILSRDTTVSCASCHKPAFAFADASSVSTGVNAGKGNRNTLSAMNVRLQHVFFWDGRAGSLEEQALMPIENPVEMNLSIDSAVKRLEQNSSYRNYFQTIFGSLPARRFLVEAIAAFERTLETSDSPFDVWKFEDGSTAVSDAVKKGFVVFNTRGKCSQYHFEADFTQPDFRNIGLFDGKECNDSGRAFITKKADDIGKFEIGSLRNVAVTAPYMHNGKFKTLKEVIEFYNDPEKIVPGSINRDSLLAKPLRLTQQEKNDLEAFLPSLTDKRFAKP